MKMYKVYTDGACSVNPGPGGWAAIFLLPSGIKQLKGGVLNTTNNRMELQAVIEAIRKITKLRVSASVHFRIYSDSAYVVNAINQGWLKRWEKAGWTTSSGDKVKNLEQWIELASLLEKCKDKGVEVSFEKVKGHSGDKYNEMVDELAREQSLRIKVGK